MVDWSSGNISHTAANMAMIRALETAKPPDLRLFSDPFALRFLPPWHRALMLPVGCSPWRRMIEGIFDRKAPGARTSGAARTRLIDIWEGVTNYLNRASVDATFETFSHAVPGSRVIFTYVHADAIAGRFPSPGLSNLLGRLRRIGEAWTFGFRPETVPDYLAQRGFRLIADLSAAEYRARYRPRPERPEGYEFYHAVLAEKIA
jgi:O-methyltransferase involved in polyketide biosynthesis